LLGQEAKEDFARINANILGAAKLLVETEYKVFPNHYSQTPKEVSHGIMKQDGNKIYQQIASLQALISNKMSIHMDTVEKLMVISNPVKLESQRTEALKVDLLSSLSKCKRIQYTEVDKTIGMYTLEFKDNVETEFDKCEFYFNRLSFLPYRLVLYYDEEMDMNDDKREVKNETPRLEITFIKIETSPVFRDSDFDETRFIKQRGNKLLVASLYKGYRLIDNRYSSN